MTDDFGDVRAALDAVEHRRPRQPPRGCLGGVDPVAVAATEDHAVALAAGADVEDGLVLVGPGPVDDLDQRELLRLGAELLGADPARGGLEVRAVPAAVARRGGGEVVVDLRQRALERGA